MLDINNKIKFDGIEFKKGAMYFYNLQKIFLNLYYKKYYFHIIISYRGGEINLGDMWKSYNLLKNKNKKYPQNFKFEDIEELGLFLSKVRKGMIIKKNDSENYNDNK